MGGLTVVQSGALAQVTIDYKPTLPQDYDLGRNISVLERQRPEYDALGIRSGGMSLYPRMEIGGVVNSNVYSSGNDNQKDVYLLLAPSMDARSDWSRHAVRLYASSNVRRYASQTILNREEWQLAGLGRVDIGDGASVTGELQGSQRREEPFSSQIAASLAALSTYQTRFAALRAQRRVGRTRFLLAGDTSRLRFDDLEFGNGERQSQKDRNRKIRNLTGQAEYALSPGLIAFAQGTYIDIDYERALLNGDPNRNSHGWRGLVGFNMDLAGFLRGTFGIGYGRRNYRAGIYEDAGGLNIQGELTYFYSPQTDVSLQVRRDLEDALITGRGAFFDTAVVLKINHELKSNILLDGRIAYQNQDYVQSSFGFNAVTGGVGLSYLLNSSLRLRGYADYGHRISPAASGVASMKTKVDQASVGLSLIIQR